MTFSGRKVVCLRSSNSTGPRGGITVGRSMSAGNMRRCTAEGGVGMQGIPAMVLHR